MKEATEQGLAVYEQLRGTERANRMKATIDDATFGASMTELSMDFVFGSVWAREGLDQRARSLVTLGILIALRQRNELKNHVEIALTNGLTADEIEEVMIQASAYAGFPAARDASNAAAEALETLGFGRGK
ncbi:carboxymuconolactone decarboxylase family protein [Paraburkholderia bryophila]|uniref:4-carboxymuconolactone decarboxylase n=1 Tax=Paraburkholderia bryophila TaxID=420952 RepID=A0A329CBD0_9BURK|nr:carboxymuconolactone decarboxylase family protein [Paraburkholderia bryophila]RAS32079.1 4-carboxymuconolactone decarboxylase [Paraburkholderia bryophila]